MKVIWLIIAGAVAACGLGVLAWVRERQARTVFPASQAASLLNPARRLIQPPRQAIAAFAIDAGQRVLEVGPGPGYFTSEAAQAVGGSGQIVCVDLQVGMLEELRRRLDETVRPRVRMLAADAMRLPFAEASFDRAFLVAVLGEVPDPPQALAELRRVLRPGGIVSFYETFTDPDYMRGSVLRKMCNGAGLSFVDRQRQRVGYIMRFARPN